MAGRRLLAPERALEWRPGWSQSDRARIQVQFDRLNVLRCYEPPSKGYVGCENAAGRKVMFIAPGYVHFPHDLAPEGLCEPDWPGFTLSTFRERSPTANFDVDDSKYCPIHGYQLPLTGRCDRCEE